MIDTNPQDEAARLSQELTDATTRGTELFAQLAEAEGKINELKAQNVALSTLITGGIELDDEEIEAIYQWHNAGQPDTH